MSRFTKLSDEELQAEAEKQGIKNASSLTRNQLETALVKDNPDVSDESVKATEQMAKRGAFTTPLVEEGKAATRRKIEGEGGEVPPAPGDNQPNVGGTGGVTTTTTGNTNPGATNPRT